MSSKSSDRSAYRSCGFCRVLGGREGGKGGEGRTGKGLGPGWHRQKTLDRPCGCAWVVVVVGQRVRTYGMSDKSEGEGKRGETGYREPIHRQGQG